jgi:hypothetical protein
MDPRFWAGSSRPKRSDERWGLDVSNELHMAVALSDEFLSELASCVIAKLDRPRERFPSKPALASHYGVSERTIKTWREKGLPGVRVGREVMFDVGECDRWIESHA